MAVIDPENALPAIDWQTRKAFLTMGAALERQGYDLRVRSGRRSCAEQNAIYAQGRTAPGPIVTEAPGCYSWHVMGRAIDADPVDRRTGLIAGAIPGVYAIAGAIWERLGGVWGGRFSIGDYGHFELHPGLNINALCPSAAACNQAVVQIATVEPAWSGGSPWLYAIGSFALVGVLIWIKSWRTTTA